MEAYVKRTTAANVKRIMSRNTKQTIAAYVMIAMPLIGFFVFILYPMFWAAFKSLYYYTGVPSNTRFVGLINFINAFKDAVYWKTWVFTFKFTALKLVFEIPLALVVALMLSRKLKLTGLYRCIFFLPNIISIGIVGVIFTIMFDFFGVINEFLIKIGFIATSIDWFSTAGTAMAALVIGSVWQTFGINVLYFLSALSNVPQDCYEAAEIDGAGAFAVFRKITLPLIAPVFQIILLLAINGTLSTSEYILVATNGSPGGSTFTVMSYVVSKFVPGFAQASVNIGYGCGISIITSVVYCLIAVGYMKISKKMANTY